MRAYIPIAEIEARDPDWAARIRLRDRKKTKRLREADPDRVRSTGREQYAKNRQSYLNRKREWCLANPEKVRAIKDKHWITKRSKYLLSHIRSQAKIKGVAFDLTVEWIEARLAAGVCEMSGLPFDLEGKQSPNGPSVDRRIAGSDYTQANCRMILWSLNRALFNYGEDYVLNVFQHVLARRARE